MKNNIFDSNIHVQDNSFEHLNKISKEIKNSGISRALCMFDNEKNIKDRKIFYENCKKTGNLTPVAFIRNTKNLKNEIKNIKRIGFKFIKFHPRNLNLKIGNKFYLRAFKLLNRIKICILWCTYDGWSTNKISQEDQLAFLAKLNNINKKNIIILMHSGGPNISKYYEKFRFCENIFFDLSYTIIHYRNTSIERDILFMFQKFDKRIITGSDYPSIKIKSYYNNLLKLIKKSKISKLKKKNILYNNLRNICEKNR